MLNTASNATGISYSFVVFDISVVYTTLYYLNDILRVWEEPARRYTAWDVGCLCIETWHWTEGFCCNGIQSQILGHPRPSVLSSPIAVKDGNRHRQEQKQEQTGVVGHVTTSCQDLDLGFWKGDKGGMRVGWSTDHAPA